MVVSPIYQRTLLVRRMTLTSGRHVGEMDTSLMAQLGQHESPDYITAHSLEPIVLAPVDVRTSGLTGTVNHVSRLELVEDLIHLSRVLHAVVGGMDSLALRIEQVSKVAADPAFAACKKKAVFGVHVRC
jgi:hypothetical protein